jgi:hypothetical protein
LSKVGVTSSPDTDEGNVRVEGTVGEGDDRFAFSGDLVEVDVPDAAQIELSGREVTRSHSRSFVSTLPLRVSVQPVDTVLGEADEVISVEVGDVLERFRHPNGVAVLDETPRVVHGPALELPAVEGDFPELESVRRFDRPEVERPIITVLHAVAESTEEREFLDVLTRWRVPFSR